MIKTTREKIIIVGMGGHAKSLIDAIERMNRYEVVGFVDVNEKLLTYKNYHRLGDDSCLAGLYESGITHAAIGVGFVNSATSQIRKRIYDRIKKIGFRCPPIIDPSAVLSDGIKVGDGTYIGKLAVINSDAQISDICIVNTGAIVEHDCFVGENSHIAIGARLCGGVSIGKDVFVGAGSTIVQGINVKEKATIGAGAVVLRDVDSEKMVVGVPAK